MTQRFFKKNILVSSLMAVALLCLSLPNAAIAKHDSSNKGHQKQSQRLNVSSGNQAAQMAKGRYGGKVLKVSRHKVGGDPGYKVKLVTADGRIIYVKVNAVTGSVD